MDNKKSISLTALIIIVVLFLIVITESVLLAVNYTKGNIQPEVKQNTVGGGTIVNPEPEEEMEFICGGNVIKYTYDDEEYYVFSDEYDGEFYTEELTIPVRKNIDGLECSKVMTYEEYANYCNTWNIEKKYEKEDGVNYIVFTYVANDSLQEYGLAYVEYGRRGTATLYLYDKYGSNLVFYDSTEADAITESTTTVGDEVETFAPVGDVAPIAYNPNRYYEGYTIIIPTNQTVKNVDYVALMTQDDYDAIKGVSYPDHPITIKKPIIYIYPEKDMNVSVKLPLKDNITVSYPKYVDGWNVIAKKDGTLIDLDTNKELYSLYYEARPEVGYEVKEDGFVVEGKDVAEFLDNKLEVLGLNAKEREEFIVYWLPILEGNKYNYIRFATTEEINENTPLEITPAPQTLIRVMMTFKGLDNPIDVKEQELTKVERNGYTVVEWGATELK